jgi:ribonuclease III
MGDTHHLPAQSPDPLTGLETKLGYSFRDRAYLILALTHRSFAFEISDQNPHHNEALEFLGDAVLGFLISARIFRRFPQLDEGALSKIKAYLVSAVHLARFAEGLDLGSHLRISRNEEKSGGREKRAIMVDAFEAVIAAIYIDGGIEAAAAFVDRQMEGYIDALDIAQLTSGDFKSALQEKLHDLGLPEPVYELVKEIGPDHQKTFVIQVRVGEEVISEAAGKTKKEAQKEAARLALEHLTAKPGSEPS